VQKQVWTTKAKTLAWRGAAVFLLGFPVGIETWGQAQQTTPRDLTSTSIEDLVNVEVTSVSKKEQKLSKTAAAIFVITQEDIRRSGATNIPDLLRMVPGLDVEQINGSTWAVGSRGFSQQFANKLQVTVDGRSIYSSDFSGVLWDTVDLPLPDIERIEVIRGPGGSIWGANAVTGVISIFTKKASETLGTFIETGAGTLQQGFGMAQYGGGLGKATDFRIYTKYFNQSDMLGLNGQNGSDGWHRLREGFRIDSKLSPQDSLMLEGDLSTGREGAFAFQLPSVTSPAFEPVSEEINLGNGSIESIWNHTYTNGSDSNLEFSFDQHRRNDPLVPEVLNTFDLDFKHHLTVGPRQDFVWGLGYRETSDRFGGSLTATINPRSLSRQLFNSFVQDEIPVVPERLFLTVGAKLEHNDYTGFGFMPSVRTTWAVTKNQMAWAAVSRALRTPSREDTNLVVNFGSFVDPSGTLILIRFVGNPRFQNERLIAYEAGYRFAVSKHLSLDVASYFDDYHNLQTSEPGGSVFEPTPAPPHVVQTLTFQNLMHGEAHGFEIAANWKITDRWQMSPGFAFAKEHMHTSPPSVDTRTGPFVEGSAPDRMAQLRSHIELMRALAWDASAYYVDPLTNQGPFGNVRIPADTRLDTGLTWKPWERFSVSIVGQNLLRDHHQEFEDVFGSLQSGQIKRSAYAKMAWQF